MNIPVSQLDIPSNVKNSLLNNDIIILKDFDKEQLVKCLDPSLHTHIDKILQECEKWRQISISVTPKNNPILPISVADLKITDIIMDLDKNTPKIALFPTIYAQSCTAKPLKNSFLNGIFQLGSLVEICGDTAIGKTQLCMQLALNCQLKAQFGGVNGETFYIDTEGGYDPVRVMEMSIELKQRIINYVKNSGDTTKISEIEDEMRVEPMLGKIRYIRLLEQKELSCLLQNIENILKTFKNVFFPFSFWQNHRQN